MADEMQFLDYEGLSMFKKLLNGVDIVAATGDGTSYTATIPGVDALKKGMLVTIIPDTTSAATIPTLNINSLGAKNIKQRLAVNTSLTAEAAAESWMIANKPVPLMYDGTQWVNIAGRPAATTLYGTVPISAGGTDASTAAEALLNLGAIGYQKALTSADDMNNIKDSGVYAYSTSSVPANAPYTNAAVVLVMGSASTASQTIQIGFRYGAAGKMTFRALYNGGWQEWTEVLVNINSLITAPKYEIAYDNRDQFIQDGAYGINLRNSDIYQANGIYFSHANDEDISDQFYEGLNFPRNDGKWDSLRIQEGVLQLVTGSTNEFGKNNAAKGSEYTVDYPVASGTSGIWTYRKWASGIAECWGKVTTTGTAGTSSLGTATSMPYQMYTVTFPFTFASAPVVTIGGIDGGTGLATASVSESATKTGATVELVGSTAAIASGCYVHVIGQWK